MRKTTPKRLAPTPKGTGPFQQLADALKSFKLSDFFSTYAAELALCASIALSLCALVMLLVRKGGKAYRNESVSSQ